MDIDRNEYKVMALRERMAQIVSEYEDRIADLRVELTIVSQRLERYETEREAELDAQASEDK